MAIACGTGDDADPADPADPADAGDDAADTAADFPADAQLSPSYRYLEITSDPARVAALDCAAGSAPGPDIDAATLYSNPSLLESVAALSDCVWAADAKHCDSNIAAAPVAAEGPPDADPFAGFVSLNGGGIRCEWADGQALELGMLVVVTEVGAAEVPEPYRIRACEDPQGETCGPWVDVNGPQQTVPAGKLLL